MISFFSWFCKIFIKPIVGWFFIKEVKGLENIPKQGFILAANHQSHLDEIATGYIVVPRRCYFIGQTDAYTGLARLGRDIIYFFASVIRLNRKSEESRKKALDQAIKLIKKGDIVILYPEGTRTRTGKIGEGRWGVARIFLKTGAPILPVGIKGTFELLPPGGKLKIKRIVKINIGKPLYLKKELELAKKINEQSENYKKILEEITDKIMENIKQLTTKN